MITLYRPPEGRGADEMEDALEEMVIAYETEIISEDTPLPEDVSSLPALRDDGEVIAGGDALNNHLEELRSLMVDWDRYQSDACYLGEDGTVC